MKKTIATPLLALILLSPVTAGAASGKAIVTGGNGRGAKACSACHGANGSGNAATGYPRLAGLNPAYIAKQLHDFADDSRHNDVMQPIAKALNAKEIQAVAGYYAKQKGVSAANSKQRPSPGPGKDLVLLGDWTKRIPACVQCHGPGARGVGSHFPSLAGQHASYIEMQLKAWKSGQRSNDPDGLMKAVAERLSSKQIKAAAAYLQSLPSHLPSHSK